MTSSRATDPGLLEDRALPVAAVARLLGVEAGTVRRLVRAGHLSGFRLGQQLRIWQSSVERMVAGRAVGAAAPAPMPTMRVVQKQATARQRAAEEGIAALGI